MTRLLRAKDMRALEREAIDAGRVSGDMLMERAGEGTVRALMRHWADLGDAAGRAVVLCGPGNNGGDGLVIARCLKLRGWTVDVHLLGDAGNLPPDAATNHARWAELGPVVRIDPAMPVGHPCREADLAIDAFFGIGLTRPVTLPLEALFEGARRVVAVDVPSGLCADSGRVLGGDSAGSVRADLTVTFHCAKPGHYLAEGPAHCGSLAVEDIGL